jgi:hypothetical protein
LCSMMGVVSAGSPRKAAWMRWLPFMVLVPSD